jgi:hypothetical protein
VDLIIENKIVKYKFFCGKKSEYISNIYIYIRYKIDMRLNY